MSYLTNWETLGFWPHLSLYKLGPNKVGGLRPEKYIFLLYIYTVYIYYTGLEALPRFMYRGYNAPAKNKFYKEIIKWDRIQDASLNQNPPSDGSCGLGALP